MTFFAHLLFVYEKLEECKVKVFNFRIIYGTNGTDVIDQSLSTPYNSLTPKQMQDYIEVDNQLAAMAAMKRIEHRNNRNRSGILQKMAMALGVI